MNLVTEEFNIKGMVCNRCVKVLNSELKAIGAEVVQIQLGKTVIQYEPNKISKSLIEQIITENEFEIISDKENLLTEQIKHLVINYLWNTDQRENLSDYLSTHLGNNYNQLSKNFSKTFGKTIERYSVLLKIERTKEMIEHHKLSFSEIAYKLGYQNLSSLSRQFKKETRMSMKEYKNLGLSIRTPIDKIG